MPNIKTYDTPQLEYQAPNVESTARLERTGDMARAVGNLGEGIGQLGKAIFDRQAQEETSDLNAGFSELSADLTNEIDEGTRNGTIDTAKFMESVDKRLGDLSNNIGTGAGRRTYERNAARIRQQAFKSASRGQAAIAGARAESNIKTEMASYSSSLFSDPSGFKENHQAMMDSIQDQVDGGSLPAQAAEKLKFAASADLAKASVRGWARLDPELAQKKLHSGSFDGFLDGDQKAQMQTYINEQRRAKQVEANREEAAIKKAQKARTDAFWEKNLNQIIRGTLDTETIMNSGALKGKDKMQMINLVNKNSENGGGVTNPRVKNQLTQQILNGQITDIQQIVDDVGKGINTKDLGELNSLLAKTPEGEAMIDGEKRLFELAKKTIGAKDMATGMWNTDADSEYNLSRFMFDYSQAKNQIVKDGKNPSELVNPNSKDYFGTKAKAYKLSPQQTIAKQAEIARQKAAAGGEKRIRVISPSGQAGTILESQKDIYLKQGFRLGE